MAQLQHFSPRQLLVVGDLFHSVANKELDLFRKWRNDLPDLSIQLVKGNHDILKDDWYANAGISIFSPTITEPLGVGSIESPTISKARYFPGASIGRVKVFSSSINSGSA